MPTLLRNHSHQAHLSKKIVLLLFGYLLFFHGMAQTDSLPVPTADTLIHAADTLKKPTQVKDRLYLRNSSFVQGKLLKMEYGRFNFRADQLTTLNIDKRNVATLQTPLNLVRVEMISGEFLYGKFEPLPVSGKAFLRTSEIDSTAVENGHIINLLEIDGIYVDNKNFFKNIRGDVTAGLSYTRSSAITRFNFANSLLYSRNKYNLEQRSSAINTLSDTIPPFERLSASLLGYYKMPNKWRAAVLFEYQRLAELGISGRLITSMGMGYPVINTRRTSLVTLAGLSFNRERTFTNKISPILFEFPVLMRFSLYKLKSNDFTITATTYFYQGITNSKRRRLDQSTIVAFSVFKDIDISIELFVNFDSQPKTAGVNLADYGTVFGLSYKF